MRAARLAAGASLVLLLLLCLAWELWLAPLSPGGTLLALKAAPLALPLGGILSGRRYTYQWSSLLILGYLAEGLPVGQLITHHLPLEAAAEGYRLVGEARDALKVIIRP